MVLSCPLVGRSECHLHSIDEKCQCQYLGAGGSKDTGRLEKPCLTLCFQSRLLLEMPTCPVSTRTLATEEGVACLEGKVSV